MRMIGHRGKKLEHQECLWETQGASRPENLHQNRSDHDFLDEETFLAGALQRIDLSQLCPRRATELVDLLFQRGVSFAIG